MKANYKYGKNALLDAINNHVPIKMVYLLDKNPVLQNKLVVMKIPFLFKPRIFFDEITTKHYHQGVVFETFNSPTIINLNTLLQKLNSKPQSLILILDEIQDVGNLAAIIRTANAFAVDAIIYKKDRQVSLNNPTIIKNSMNAIEYIDLCEVVNLNQTIDLLKVNQFWVYASALTNNAQKYYDVKYPAKTAIVLGNEHKGISALTIKNADEIMYIPQFGHVQSLNVSVAAGILLADYCRKKM